MLVIDYRLAGASWADCTIRVDRRECEVSASYLSDALGNLVLAAVAVLAGAHSISVAFDEEPGEYRWPVVRTDGGTVRLTVLMFQEPGVIGRMPRARRCPHGRAIQSTLGVP